MINSDNPQNLNFMGLGMRRSVEILWAAGILALFSGACGQTHSQSSEGKVYGGTLSESGAWLNTVAVVEPIFGMNCTGTAINPSLVVTAAHCLAGKRASQISVYVGDGVDGGYVSKGQYAAASILSHPKYSRFGPGGNDIGFITLKNPLNLPEEAYVKVLLESEEIKELLEVGAKATIVGFGNRDDGGSGLKLEVETTVVPKISLSHDPKTEVAIGGSGKDSCNGDSGGPVFGQLKNGEWRVYGITSRGGNCGTGGIYGLIHANICWVERESGVNLNLPEGYCEPLAEGVD